MYLKKRKKLRRQIAKHAKEEGVAVKLEKLNAEKNEQMRGEKQGLKRFVSKSAGKLKGFTRNETLQSVRI